MFDKIISVISTAFVITGIGIALRPGAPTAKIVEATTTGIARMQSAAFGPTGKSK